MVAVCGDVLWAAARGGGACVQGCRSVLAGGGGGAGYVVHAWRRCLHRAIGMVAVCGGVLWAAARGVGAGARRCRSTRIFVVVCCDTDSLHHVCVLPMTLICTLMHEYT